MSNKNKGAGALFIPAGLILGMGIGFLVGNFNAWLFIGLGLGFVCFAISMILKK